MKSEREPHILCRPGEIAESVLLPGDPARVDRLSRFLDEGYREIACNREFKTVTGTYKGVPVTAVSTGIGGASLVIAVEELIRCGAKNFIRIGSCGACQKNIGIGDLVLSSAAVREDGAGRMYLPEKYPAAADFLLTEAAVKLLRASGYTWHHGITRSHDSFYIDDEQERMEFWSHAGVLASDMETAALYLLASYRRVRALSILNNVVRYQEDVKEGIGEYVDEESSAARGEEHEISIALETVRSLYTQVS